MATSSTTRHPLDRPNIILVNCDDLGYGDIGAYGSRINATPYLDRMAREGTVFTSFYMASPVCSPSRGAMLTGCYPPRISFDQFEGRWVLFPGQGVGLHPDEATFATLLKTCGYATQLIGKWHCGDQPAFLPTRHGFDHYYGLPYSNDMGRQAGRTHYPPLPLLRDEQVIQEQPNQAALTERYVEEAVRFMRAHRDQPFLLYFAHMYVHLPIYPPEHLLKASRNGPYGAAVACIDWAMGVLFDELRQLGLDRNTLVLFTSDNGSRGDHGGSNGPLRGAKGTTWEGGQRVPCIAWWPGQVPAGASCPELATAMDFCPTFAALAGASLPGDRTIDGQDIRPLLFGERGARSPHQAFFYYLMDRLDAVRCGRWKLFVGHNRQNESVCELYDLEHDVGETTDLHETYPEIVQTLLLHVERCRKELGDGRLGIQGKGRRPIGCVDDPKPLTTYDPEHPYIIAMYDLEDAG